jgi:hydroxylaminobenzene mutase
MNASITLARQSHRLLQIGGALLLFSALEGFVISALPVPRLGLSVHTLSALEGVITIALGLMWPRLVLRVRAAGLACWLFVYSAFATLIPYILAALWGAGNSVIPLAAGEARGTPLQEAIILVILITAAPTVIVSLGLMLWGLRFRETAAP